ncbi:hypothetical protein MNV49_003911 [Pseudohyphozyma bogoriensis]|nr:hypothetical protein MNV49_003911 [Pseudohyphozyma bogoriensis]
MAYKLELLNSIQPLLKPTLPPSPPPSATDEIPDPIDDVPLPATKRKADEPRAGSKTVGLGLTADVRTTGELGVKRVRVSPTANTVPLPPQHAATANSHLKAPTPDLRSHAFPTASHKIRSDMLVPPSPVIPSAGLAAANTKAWRVDYSHERLKRLAGMYRGEARDLKRLGDKTAREDRSARGQLHSTVLQTDALLLYVFGFWCDDQAIKGCNAAQWQSLFGLLTWVKGCAEKAGASIITGICLRMEAHVVHLLSTHEQKNLVSRGLQYGAGASASPSIPPPQQEGRSPSSQASPSDTQHRNNASPPSTTPSSSTTTAAAADLIKSYTKAGHELFRYPRLYEESCVHLTTRLLISLPETWHRCIDTNLNEDATGMVIPVKPWRFAWPVEMGRAMSVPHTVVWARAMLEEWARSQGVEYEAVSLVE